MSENQGQGIVTAPVSAKQSGQFSVSGQAFGRMGWNSDMSGLLKAKQDEVMKNL